MRTIALIGAILILPLPEVTGNAYAAKVGQRCGGPAGITCDQGLWCDALPGKCGAADISGKCIKVPQPQACTAVKIVRQVCGCDGSTYSNNCERQSKMVALKSIGRCK
jgi:Kazal-type serine protease inhibitor domain